MSIQELMPFEETFADTAAIYSILGVPRSLIPTKEGVTFNNGFTDERKLYADVAIPQAEAIATQLTSFLGLKELGLKIRVRFDHVEALQQDQKLNAETQKLISETYTTLYEKGHITKNQMLVELGLSEIPNGDYYISKEPNKPMNQNQNNQIEKPVEDGTKSN